MRGNKDARKTPAEPTRRFRLSTGNWQLTTGNLFLLLLLFSPTARAGAWFDDSYRRPIDVIWDAERAGGTEICYTEMDTAGHLNTDGSDLRVSTDEGRQVAAKVLRVGPGDRVSFVFYLVKGVRRYYAYFGNPKPAVNRAGMDEVKIEWGLLLDTRQWKAVPVENFQQMQDAWAKAGPPIGQTMIDAPFLGVNLFGTPGRSISKITGAVFSPLEGDYHFAVFAEDRGALYIDGTPVVFAVAGPADVRNQGKIHLKRGRHEFVFYHATSSGEGRFTVAWQRPDSRVFEVLPRGAFGVYSRGNAGALEQLHQNLVADFSISYVGECFYADGYSHRYTFTARAPNVTVQPAYTWDFGDGQTGAGEAVDHVYLSDDIYAVKLTVRVGVRADTQTSRFAVSRDWAHIDKPATDDIAGQSKIVGTYEVSRMPENWLPRATLLHERAGQIPLMLPVAERMAALAKHPDANQALAALQDASKAAVAKSDVAAATKLWEAIPPASDLNPRATVEYGKLLLWQAGDFARAVQALPPFVAGNDAAIRRLYADALVLDQKPAEGRKILEAIPVTDEPEKRAARSGALARTIEYYIVEKDWETGEQQWDHWQEQYPADFLEGYSIVLKAKLMELKGAPVAAAKVAEAFAMAVPGSSYSPQLLFRAGKLLEATDSAKSQSLIKLLKTRYPEDPLAQ